MACDRREVMFMFDELKAEIDRVEKKSSDEVQTLSDSVVPYLSDVRAAITLFQASLDVIMEKLNNATKQIIIMNKSLEEAQSTLKKEQEDGIHLKKGLIAALHYMRAKLDPSFTSSLPVIIRQPNVIRQEQISEMVPLDPVPPVVPSPNAAMALEAHEPF